MSPLNAKDSIVVTLSGISMLVKPIHPENAPYFILVTLFGISILVRPIKLENAESPILVTYSPSYLAGIIMSISIPIYSET